MSTLLNNTLNAIKAVIKDTPEDFKLPAYVCVIDAKKRDAENIVNYSPAQRQAADALFEAVETTYGRSKVYRNYRKGFVAVKVNAPMFADKVSLRAAKLDSWADANNIVREHTRHGHLVYRATAEVLDALTAV